MHNLNAIPGGLTGRSINGGSYSTYKAIGKIADGTVLQEWTKIWNTDLARVYTADFEVYGDKAQNPDNAEIDIFVAVK